LSKPSGGHFGNIVTAAYAAMAREIKVKGSQARFQKSARGQFAY
jgi:hypothetical protein